MLTTPTTIDLERQMLGEVEMVGRERWEENHRRASSGASIRAIARELDLDRKTVRRCLRRDLCIKGIRVRKGGASLHQVKQLKLKPNTCAVLETKEHITTGDK